MPTREPAEQPLKSVERRQKVQERIERRKKQVVPMLAERLPLREVAHTLGVGISTAQRDSKDPVVQHDLKYLREQIKRQILEHTADGLVGPLVQLTKDKIAAGEARDVDASLRGLNALEKTTASASGEAQRVQLDATVRKVERTELFARMEALIEHVEST